MNLPMVLTPDGPVPLYLQIKYQITYLITSGQLVTGNKLPPVRSVAAALDVNPGTVAQAYRELRQEGLIEAAVGRGTFVAPTISAAHDAPVRQREAAKAIDAALDRLRALGLSDGEIRLRFEAVLASKPVERQVLLVAPSQDVGHKYSASLDRRLGSGVKLHQLTYADLERQAPHVSLLLELCYFVVTFASSVRRVEIALEAFGKPFRLLGLTTELLPESVAELQKLAPGSKIVILSEERYAHQSLGLVLQHAPVIASDVELVTLEDLDDDTRSGLRTGSTFVVHTFGATRAAASLGVEKDRMLELRFDVADDSLTRIKALLTSA